jgi:hypothetical protein
MILDKIELVELTGRSRRNAQLRALKFMGIEHRVRPDGSVVVLTTHVESILSGRSAVTLKRAVEPNWGAI